MNKEALLYFIAAGLFAAAAGISVGSSSTLTLSSVLLLAAAVAFAWLGAKKRGPQS